MKIFISGICGFVGSELALGLPGQNARRASEEFALAKSPVRWGKVLN